MNYKDKKTVKGIKVDRAGKRIKSVGAFVITLYTIGVVCLSIDSVVTTATKCKYNSPFDNIGWPSYFIGFVSLLMLFAYRLIKTFENTKFAFSDKQVLSIKISMILGLSFVIMVPNLLFSGVVSETNTWKFAGAGIGVLVLFAALLLYLFIRKLRTVIEDFIEQFGKITPMQLAQLNKSLRYVFFVYQHLFCCFVFCLFCVSCVVLF